MSGPEGTKDLVVGVLSDTHGQLYPRVRESLRGVDHIIHAGDIGSAQVLAELKTIAPVTAVRGNCDLEAWAQGLPTQACVQLGGALVLVRHIAGRLGATLGHDGRGGGRDASPQSEGAPDYAVAISGHSHMAAIERRGGTLYLNPGSAGPRRFQRPRTLARLVIGPAPPGEPATSAGGRIHVGAEIITIDDG